MNLRLASRMLGPVVLAATLSIWSQPASACPGCKPEGDTLCAEMGAMDAAVVARLVAPPPANAGRELQPSRFEVTRVLKGERLVRVSEKLEVLHLGGGKEGDQFLILGIARPQMLWSTPRPFSNRAVDYLSKLMPLSEKGIERYRFVLDYLEDDEAELAQDAYNEFAQAPYADVRALKNDLSHDEIVARVQDASVPATRRRLYLVMLGIAGDERDVSLLEEMLRSDDRQQRRGLDMIIFCYLSIRGPQGLPVIEELFLSSRECDYSDTYAAIMALRMHAAEKVTLEPKHVVGPLRQVLQRPDMADLVIPDLARYEDWTAIDKLLELYRTADEKVSWVRVPVVNYLRACPLPRAKELLAECERIDPQAVKRAHSFFPSVTPPATDPSTQSSPAVRQAPVFVSTAAEAVPASFTAPVPEPDTEVAAASPAAASASPPAPSASPVAAVASLNPGVAPAKALKSADAAPPNLWYLLGVPILSGAVLWMLQSSILRGRIGRG